MTGCTTMRIDEGVDTGHMLLRAETPIRPDDNAGTLTARLAQLGADLLVRTPALGRSPSWMAPPSSATTGMPSEAMLVVPAGRWSST